jgi:translation elongation factor EF-1alpha
MPEEEVGKVSSYFAKIGVAAIELTGSLSVGDTIHIKGHTTDFEQNVDSIQIEHQNVEKANPGDSIGIKAKDRVREHDVVYKVTE